jgi:hypothetical protein
VAKQPGKSLYTTLRELIENGLDAAEAIGELPDLEITIEELSLKTLNKEMGIGNRERVDSELYDGIETAKERKKREAKQMKEAARQVSYKLCCYQS